MSLTLYIHPLASFCHKVLIPLYENGTPFTAETVNFADPGAQAQHLDRWPVGKIPVLHDAARGQTIPETTIILEYLQTHYPGPLTLLPEDAEERLQVRLWDRFFDLYIHTPMQKIVVDRLRPEGQADAFGVTEARSTLDTAYQMVDSQLNGRDWATGPSFTLADCSAIPALFYALIVHPAPPELSHLAAYFERLMARPSVQRVLEEARPFFQYFPYADAMPSRFRNG